MIYPTHPPLTKGRGVVRVSALLFVLLFASTAWSSVPMRVVSLKPAITDTFYALGFGDRLVGVTRYCDIPEGKHKPKIVGDYTKPYVERIVALSPDIVLGSRENSSRRSIEGLERMGITVKLLHYGTIESSLKSIRSIAELMGEPERGTRLSNKIRMQLFELKKQYGKGERKRVLIVWGVRPLVVAGLGTYMDNGLGYIGALNVVETTRVRYPKIGLEEIIALNPDVIVDLSMGSESDDTAARPWERTDAIKARTVRMDADDFRPGPRLVEGLKKLAKEIHK